VVILLRLRIYLFESWISFHTGPQGQ